MSTPDQTFPVLPLRGTVLFPTMAMPLAVGRPPSLKAVEAALAREEKTLAVFTQKDPAVENPAAEDLHDVGTLAVITKMERSEEGMQVLVQGTDRIRLVELTAATPYLQARVLTLPLPAGEGTEIEALVRTVREQADRIRRLAQPNTALMVQQVLQQVKDPRQLAYMLATVLNLKTEDEAALLRADTLQELLQRLTELLAHEIQVLELQRRIAGRAQSAMEKQQREYFLRQQLEAIKKELGEEEEGESEAELLRQRLEEADLPDTVRAEAERELKRLEKIPSASPEYQVIRSYLELILELPWRKYTEDNLDLERARRILDEDHYGLEEVKERILEHLAVMKLNPEAPSPILCFVGPPGTGKTSLGQSIARAMGRKFERMALGGLHDEAELRGHRRTYIGAMPGRIIQAIRRAGVANPLLMLDEVDKLGRDFRGDPAAALMEILDPAQNKEFRDNYLDLPFDLSKVFFITTANTLDTIPGPLLDRMEVLELDGYTLAEKVEIARRYLLPRRLREAGLTPEQLQVPGETLQAIIQGWTREAGLRQLERALGRIARKVALKVASGETAPVRVEPGGLTELLGPRRYVEETARRSPPPGVAAGLAWTPTGGEVLYVEAVLLPYTKDFKLTGQLGEVMRESAEAARSWVHAQARTLEIPAERLEQGVHLHVPAGAIPKDGPSAGVTMAVALTSLYTEEPVRSDTAMTGEITLTGLLLPIGGVKQKVLAAHRAGIRRVILPEENRKDLRRVPASVREGIQFLFVRRVEDAIAAAIPALAGRLEACRVGAGAEE